MAVDLIHDTRLKTFKQIDELHHCTKGSAFRIFKQLQGHWVEGEHFYCIDSRAQPELFAQIQHSGRLYASTVNAVLITEIGYQAIAQILINTYDVTPPNTP